MKKFKPFENEKDSITIDKLTIENRTDQIQLYGSINITKDKEGVKIAKNLKKIIDDSLKKLLKTKDLPDKIKFKPTIPFKNPFSEN
tara:strand:+ start:297 stop:554 length:258 start_codon:yes stop_codon:yes gene_type:complete